MAGFCAGTAGVGAAFALFGLVCRSIGTPLPVNSLHLVAAGAVISIGLIGALIAGVSWERAGTALTMSALIGGVWFLALGVAYHVACLLALRVDLLSYSESGFLNDILRMESGLPIYASPLENQSTVYTPGSQILTAWIAGWFGHSLDVVTLRSTQFAYVILAAVFATAAADRLARIILRDRYDHPSLWLAWWAPMFFMVATEPRFNAYTTSLNSDGLALCLSMAGFLLMAQHALAPRAWHLLAMSLLPAAGFFVKQNLLAWAGVFGLYLFAGAAGLRRSAIVAGAGAVLGIGAMALAFGLWGQDFWFWAFESYAPKTVSVARALQHLLEAGGYLALGLAAGWIVAGSEPHIVERRVVGVWIAWLALFLLQVYTSGFAWALNHLGPSVLMSSVWFALAIAWFWLRQEKVADAWRLVAARGIAAAVVIGMLGGFGFAREPRSPVPDDAYRYFAEIESEFANGETSRILMDYGTWVYAKQRVVMKDRGFATHVHLEPNQSISHHLLADTVRRISSGAYDKILVRELDTGRSSYDFLNRGTGIREAIHERYSEVRRIRAVEGVRQWWPRHMLDEIQVFVRKETGR